MNEGTFAAAAAAVAMAPVKLGIAELLTSAAQKLLAQRFIPENGLPWQVAVPDPTGGGGVEELGGGVVLLDLIVVVVEWAEEAGGDELELPPVPGRHCE